MVAFSKNNKKTFVATVLPAGLGRVHVVWGMGSISRCLGQSALLTYTCGFGNNWVHEITVEGVYMALPVDQPPIPILYGGERAGPPEDCGGPAGHAQLLQALANPDHPEHKNYRVWTGDYDPAQFDLRTARNNLVLAAAWGAI